MWNYTWILFKKFLTAPYTYIALFLPIILIIGLGKVIPAGMIIASALTIGITINVLFLFGGSIQEIRHTSMIKSMSLTKLNKSTILLSNMLIATIYVTLTTIIILFFAFILDDVLGFLATDFSAFGDGIFSALSAEVVWSEIKWGTFLYAVILSITLSFAIAFLIIAFTKTSNSLYVVSFIYLFIMILLGGIVIPVLLPMVLDSFVQYLYHFVPHYYSNQLLASSLIAETSSLVDLIILALGLEEGETAYEVLTAIGEILDSPDLSTLEWDALNNDVDYLIGLQEAGNVDYQTDILGYQFESSFFQWLNSEMYIEITLGSGTTIVIVAESHWQLFLGTFGIQVGPIGPIYPPIDFPGPGGPSFSNWWEAVFNLTGKDLQFLIGVPSAFVNFLNDFFLPNEDLFVQLTGSVTAWDWGNLESMLITWMPLILTIIFGAIGAYYFKWSIR